MARRPRAVVSWSSGKDSAWALHVARASGEVEVVGALTTITASHERVSMHGVREELLDRQMASLGLACAKVRIPSPCPNETYEREMARALAALRAEGVSCVVFGDLFLEDVRAYREERLRGCGMRGLFPLWGRETGTLAREMIANGLRAHITCLDPRILDRCFAGRAFTAELLDELPGGVDPCGERGEFHTVVVAGPGFARGIPVEPGEVVERDGFVFADVVPAAAGPGDGRHPAARTRGGEGA